MERANCRCAGVRTFAADLESLLRNPQIDNAALRQCIHFLIVNWIVGIKASIGVLVGFILRVVLIPHLSECGQTGRRSRRTRGTLTLVDSGNVIAVLREPAMSRILLALRVLVHLLIGPVLLVDAWGLLLLQCVAFILGRRHVEVVSFGIVYSVGAER